MSSVEGLKMRLSLKHLIAPERGMGEIFKVLIQHKGIEEKPQLDGLRMLSSIPRTEGNMVKSPIAKGLSTLK